VREESADEGIRLFPRKPSSGGIHPLAKAVLWKAVKGVVRKSLGRYKTPGWSQQCMVRFRYHRNGGKGKKSGGKIWAAHARYITRVSATGRKDCGFDAEQRRLSNVPATVEGWQLAGDQMHWRMIVSPEFGEKANLEKLTREIMESMSKDLGTNLQWVAVEHRNTDNPHVHVVLRGIRGDGTPLRMEREYVKRGVRLHAERELNRQLGLKKPGQRNQNVEWRTPPVARVPPIGRG